MNVLKSVDNFIKKLVKSKNIFDIFKQDGIKINKLEYLKQNNLTTKYHHNLLVQLNQAF